MDENDLVKAGMEVALRPITDIAENALGLLGGDWLSEKRTRNRERLREKTEEILRNRGSKFDTDPSPSVVKPLLSAAQDESRVGLTDMWAALMATAMDPKTQGIYRSEFVSIAAKLDPIDARVLELCDGPGDFEPTKRDNIVQRTGASVDEVMNSFRNLARIELIFPAPGDIINWRAQPSLTTLGRQFLRAVRP
jgi:hypothetical protein